MKRRVLIRAAGAAFVSASAVTSWTRAWAQPGTFEAGPILHRGFPRNAEPRPMALAAGFVTPQADFYVRNHGNVPQLASSGYSIRIEVPGRSPVEVSVAELRSRHAARSVMAVMQCAGNRRNDLGQFKSVTGDAWRVGAISNGLWGGVGLGDVLRAAGVGDTTGQHVAFAAHDDVEEEGEQFKYGVSIPIAKALAPESMIAFEMNGEPLTADHGFPARIVIPGYAGVRSPKWLASIKVQSEPSSNFVQQKLYKLFPPDVTRQTVDLSKGTVINDMPLNSAILLPADRSTVAAGRVNVKGWAIATSARVNKVELSTDGRRWLSAELDSRATSPWSWTPWSAQVSLPAGRHELMVRAFDSAGGDQPASPAAIWNYAGYLSRAWHRVSVTAI